MTHYFPFLTLFGARRKPLLAVAAAALFCSLLFVFTAPLVAQDADTMVYTVQAGETLSEIAAQFGVDPQDLLDLNGLEDADAIFVGQTLRVPVIVDSGQPAPPGTHRVQPGETLSAIAQRYGMAVEDLLTLNQLDDANAVYAGQLLAIGAATAAPETSSSDVTDAAGEPIAAETVEPETGTTEATPAPTSETTATATLPDSHIVQPGETLTGIARRYGIPAATLKALNNLGDADYIVVGQKLILSVAEVQEQATPTPTAASSAETEATPESTATEAALAARSTRRLTVQRPYPLPTPCRQARL